jgi:hypothetical protein
MSFYTCFDWSKKLMLFSHVRILRIDVVLKASHAVVMRWFSLNEAPLGLFKFISDYLPYFENIYIFFNITSVDTEMCCPKGKCGCQYFILLTFKKKNSWTQGSWIFFNKKLILDYHFCLKFGPVFLFQICIIASLPLPRDIQLYH